MSANDPTTSAAPAAAPSAGDPNVPLAQMQTPAPGPQLSAADFYALDEGHTGPIRTPQQLLAAVFFFFVIPVFIIIGLVLFVTSAKHPSAGADLSEQAIAQRLQKVGLVEIRDANRALKSGEEVYKAQCTACHAAGVAGAPVTGNAAAWAPRIKTGFDALWQSALKGKGAMGAQGGGDYNDVEIGRAVVFLTNAAGAKFAEPAVPAAEAGAEAATATAATAATATTAGPPVVAPAAAGPSASVVAALAAANKTAAAATAASATPVVAGAGAGQALYNQACAACHAAGVAGAPKFADKAAWAPRIPLGLDALTASVIKGKGAMPPKGGAASASDADIRATVSYMLAAVK